MVLLDRVKVMDFGGEVSLHSSHIEMEIALHPKHTVDIMDDAVRQWLMGLLTVGTGITW